MVVTPDHTKWCTALLKWRKTSGSKFKNNKIYKEKLPSSDLQELKYLWKYLQDLGLDVGDTGSIPGLRRFSGGDHGNTFQYSCLENPTDRGPWWAIVHRFEKSWTRLKRISMRAGTVQELAPIVSHYLLLIYIVQPFTAKTWSRDFYFSILFCVNTT